MLPKRVVAHLSRTKLWPSKLPRRHISVSINFDGQYMANPKLNEKKTTSNETPSPWKLCASVCLIRPPVLEPLKKEIEMRYEELAEAKEYGKSCLSDWEAEKFRQNHIIQLAEAAGNSKKIQMDFKETFQDIEDQNENEQKEFLETHKQKDPDKHDLKLISRNPRESLLLITQQKLGKDTVWMLPMCEWRNGETLRKSAERALTTDFGPNTKAQFTSHAPSGFYKYKFPKEAREESYTGAKLFIYNAYLPRLSGEPSIELKPNADKVLDYAWITRDEMVKYLKPKYSKVIQEILL